MKGSSTGIESISSGIGNDVLVPEVGSQPFRPSYATFMTSTVDALRPLKNAWKPHEAVEAKVTEEQQRLVLKAANTEAQKRSCLYTPGPKSRYCLYAWGPRETVLQTVRPHSANTAANLAHVFLARHECTYCWAYGGVKKAVAMPRFSGMELS